jgi:hypothetical protein
MAAGSHGICFIRFKTFTLHLQGEDTRPMGHKGGELATGVFDMRLMTREQTRALAVEHNLRHGITDPLGASKNITTDFLSIILKNCQVRGDAAHPETIGASSNPRYGAQHV